MSEESSREKSFALIVAALVVALAMGLGLSQVGKGFATRASEGLR